MDNLKAIRGADITLLDTELLRRRQENRQYLMELDSDKLLLHHRFEAGIDTKLEDDAVPHGGWENPFSQLRGHFLGHWLSAAAMTTAATGDRELKAKADTIVEELAKCQMENGGEWCASIPEKYLKRVEWGKPIWAPQYTIHKTFMGLLDQYEYTGNRQALEIAVNFSRWFHRWAHSFSDEQFQTILDVETGGMLEIWAQLFQHTQTPMYRELMEKYYRRSLFDGLLAGEDVLTNMHANTTIPEALGAARAYEATGKRKWLDIVEAYWEQAVTKRGYFCTGGQTSGEIWTPMHSFSPRLGIKNQEHCTVYNMMRLADFLFRQTGESRYADYWERNLYNGVMAQAYYRNDWATHGAKTADPKTGLLTYFLPMKSGSHKGWASKTEDFFCCHGSLVQANACHTAGIYYTREDTLYVCQFFPSDAALEIGGHAIEIQQRTDNLAGNDHMVGSMTGSQTINRQASMYPNHPERLRNYLYIRAEEAATFTLKIRIPWWHRGDIALYINGEAQAIEAVEGFLTVTRAWRDDTVCFEFGKAVYTEALPDRPDTVAFLFGPSVLAGLTSGKTLKTPKGQAPEDILIHDDEREWARWKDSFRTTGQREDISFLPLYKVGYEEYSLYFPIVE